MPWEGGHSTSLVEEEQYFFCQLRFNPLICDLSLITPMISLKLLILFNFTPDELQFKSQISASFSSLVIGFAFI
jgi:hypothetical protein